MLRFETPFPSLLLLSVSGPKELIPALLVGTDFKIKKLSQYLAARVWTVSRTLGVEDRSAHFGVVFAVFIKTAKMSDLKSDRKVFA